MGELVFLVVVITVGVWLGMSLYAKHPDPLGDAKSRLKGKDD